MSRRWTPNDLAQVKRCADGFVEVGPNLRKRGAHKSPYLHHAQAYCRSLGVPKPEGEWYFHDDREWRLDLAWPDHKVAIEVDGGVYVDGAHARGAAIERDHEKRNAATCAGWRVLLTTPRKLGDTIMLLANTFLR